MNRIFAVTTRGLETISANELSTLPGVTVEQIAYRRVFASCQDTLASLLSLRTVDDVFLYVATWAGIDRARSALNNLREASTQLQMNNTLAICEEIRTIKSPPTFSITANFVGKRNYSTAEIKQACSAGIIEGQDWVYLDDDAKADLNVRVFIEGDTAVVGVRLAARSLSKRPYKEEHVPGSLKPAVAAGLLVIAGVSPNALVLDPCCGAGTILIEARLSGAIAYGGDNDQRAVTAARFNAAQAGTDVQIHHWDARALPISAKSVNCVISNLPWGRAVSTDGSLPTLYQDISKEIERVLTPSGQTVLLTNLPDLVEFKQMKCEQKIEISLFGQTPTIMVWSNSK